MTGLSPDLAPTIHHTFAPVGECIYCGSKDKLTNEHIIAYSLNGTAVLPLASCRKCAAITSQLERTFARGPAWPMRAAFGFKSYRKKKYPTSFPLVMVIGGKRQNINVPLAQFPIILHLPLFAALPSFLLGQRDVPITSEGTVLVSLRENTSPTELLQQIGRRYHAEGIEVPSVNYKAFARLLAKSAYARGWGRVGIRLQDSELNTPPVYRRTANLPEKA